jgi:glycosyl transferase family 25
LHKQETISWYTINVGAKKKKLYTVLEKFGSYELLKAYYFPIRTMGLIWSRKGAEIFLKEGRVMSMPIDNYLQVWLSDNIQGLSIWPPMVFPSGFESEIDKNRSNKSNKEMKFFSYNYKRQIRTWSCRLKAIRNMML